MNPVNRFALFASQILFSVITPPLLIPRIANLRFTRSFISFCFGRSYGNRYQTIIDSFQGRYGLAMAEGLKKYQLICFWRKILCLVFQSLREYVRLEE